MKNQNIFKNFHKKVQIFKIYPSPNIQNFITSLIKRFVHFATIFKLWKKHQKQMKKHKQVVKKPKSKKQSINNIEFLPTGYHDNINPNIGLMK